MAFKLCADHTMATSPAGIRTSAGSCSKGRAGCLAAKQGAEKGTQGDLPPVARAM